MPERKAVTDTPQTPIYDQEQIFSVRVRGAANIEVYTNRHVLSLIQGCSDVEFTKKEWRTLLPVIEKWLGEKVAAERDALSGAGDDSSAPALSQPKEPR